MIQENVIIVCEESKYTELYKAMFSEATGSNVVLLDRVFQNRLSCFRKLLFANKAKRITRFFVPDLFWEKFQLASLLKKLKLSGRKSAYVIFLSPSLQKYYTKEILEKIKRNDPQVKMGLLFVDPVFAPQAANALEFSQNTALFDAIYTFDKEDAEKYGFRHVDTPYSRQRGKKKEVKYDLYFCGSVKGRAGLLKEINDRLNGKVTCRWDVFSNRSTKQDEIETIKTFVQCKTSAEVLPYSEVLERSMKANCILDIVQDGQNGNTIRYYEAICNNKKLLTNNRTVLSDKYYDKRYIQHFSDAKQIDVNWIKEPCEVDFGYQGEFSPEMLIRKFISDCEA